MAAGSTSTTSTRRWHCSRAGRRRPWTRARRGGSRSRRCAPAPGAGCAGPEDGVAAQGAPALNRARQALGHAPLQPAQRLHRAVHRRVDDLLVRALVARRHDAGGGAARQARAGVHKIAVGPGEPVLDVVSAGARSHPRGSRARRRTAITSGAPALLARKRAAAAGVAGRVDIRVMDYASSPVIRPSASIGCRASARNVVASFAKLASLVPPRAALERRHRAAAIGDPEAGASQSATCGRTSRRCICRGSRPPSSAQGSTHATSRTSRTITCARCSSGSAASRRTSTARASWPATSACAVADLPRASRGVETLHYAVLPHWRRAVLNTRMATC